MKKLTCLVLAVGMLSGCASYRITSNIPASAEVPAYSPAAIMLVRGELENHEYHELGPIDVTVRKGSPFVATPTQQQADSALTQKARDMGADAVIRITYESGFDVITWGHIRASGVGVRFSE